MPLYEYRCTDCGTEFEVLQKVSDEPLVVCRNCSGRLEKLISRSAFQLKGSGWYITDYARGKKGDQAAKGEKSDKSPEKTEAKKPTGETPASSSDKKPKSD